MYSGLVFCSLLALTFGRPQDVDQAAQEPQQINAQQAQFSPQQPRLLNTQPAQYASKGASNATIINKTEETHEDGSFSFSFETSDGVRVQQNGFLKKNDNISRTSEDQEDGLIQVLMGGYAYTAPNGEVVQIQYIADENGYQPQGSHIPTLPAAAQNVVSSLEQINNSRQQYDHVVAREVSQEDLEQSEEQPNQENI